MKYVIVLRSRYTGEEIHLGSQYKTFEDAKKYADKECCERCNFIDFRPVPEDFIWHNKNIGFQPKEIKYKTRRDDGTIQL